ncbi:ribosomal protein S18-alanine N-acetyltransferase [Actinomyces vulturis]|uniref:ribosomal protein S18-alanine N-acetyltransferase n=1 Tax=Actinomyces vulturis TaxID=1857645 RepID=UPI00083492F8|nr:ribosomal protein S18-alanine N-acetyltransferase [Actinomyces vulturis]
MVTMRSEHHWRLRPLADSDIPFVAQVEADLFGAEAWSQEVLHDELHGPGHEFKTYSVLYSASQPEAIAGYAGVFCADVADVLTIATVPDCRRRGGGRHLLRHLIEVACKQNCSELFLEVRVSNEAAITLYEREDFTRLTVRKNYYMAPMEDALIMRRVLREGAHRPIGI